VSQSHPGEPEHQRDVDPLLAFNAEFAAAESAQKPTDPTPSPATPGTEDVSPVHARLEHAERSLERARIEISALKSDLATLVTAVDDIKKRLSRRPEPIAVAPPAQVAPRRGVLKIVALVLVCLTIGAGMWSLAAADIIGLPEPAPSDSVGETARVDPVKPSETELSVAPPDPVRAIVPLPASAVQTIADVAAAQPAPDSGPEGASVAPGNLAQERVGRQRPRNGAYVGSLSIDAAPAGEVFINRRPAGRTPLRADNLRAGSHLIWIERPGYPRWTRVVAVTADRVTRVTADRD
jgi:hypothetical protein